MVHLLLFGILVWHLNSEPADLPRRGVPRSMVLMDLAEPAPMSAPVVKNTASAAPVDPPPSPLLREWKTVQIRTLQPAASSERSSAAIQLAQAGSLGSGYDPYAGAAPNRLGDLSRDVAPAPIKPIADYMVSVFVQGLKVRHPGIKGAVTLKVQLNADGRVDRVIDVMGDFNQNDRNAIAKEIMGEAVGPPSKYTAGKIEVIGPLLIG